MSLGEGVAKFGLFLSLVFILPGIIYVGFVALYFPDILGQFGWNLNDSVWGLLGFSIFLGFVLTSITASIECLTRQLIFKKSSVPLLAYYEAKGLSTFYITQVFGQYICHLNVSLGVLLLAIAYVVRPYFFMSYFIMETENLLKLSFGLLIFLANICLALVFFRKFSKDAIRYYEKALKEKKELML